MKSAKWRVEERSDRAGGVRTPVVHEFVACLAQRLQVLPRVDRHMCECCVQNNNNYTIWRGSVLTGEEPPPHSGELKHALLHAGGPTQSQLSRPMSSGHHISMEHLLRRKHLVLNPNTKARSGIYTVERTSKNTSFKQKEKRQNWENEKRE